MAKYALDAYRDLKRELDKTESPSFSIRAFNHFINSAVDEYITKNYSEFPLVQKSVDDIRSIVKSSAIAYASGEASLPADYRHALDVELTLTFNVADGPYSAGNTVTKNAERERSGMEGYNQNNAFHRASWKVPYYYLIGDKLKAKAGSLVTVSGVNLTYIRVPDVIYLNPASGSDYNDAANNTLIAYPSHVYYEIIKETRRIVSENIESPRYRSLLQEMSLNPS